MKDGTLLDYVAAYGYIGLWATLILGIIVVFVLVTRKALGRR